MITRRKALLIIVIALFAVFIEYFIYGQNRRKKKSVNGNLEFFRELIEEISETVIPVTDTPGAKDAKVTDYIINVIEHCTTERDRNVILVGLENVEEYSVKKFSTSFKMCTSEDKIAVLQHFEKKWFLPNPLLNKIRRKIFGRTFFEQMKWLIVSGYCTSKLGATEGLAYDDIPINYVPCIQYVPHQRSWATN